MNIGIIYKATNIINGKSYIGQTIKILNDRISCHYYDSEKYDFAFSRALRKYSKKDWEWKIQQSDIPIQYLNEMEKFYIFLFDTYNNGYNSTTGGGNFEMSEQSRLKISIANKGKKRTQETRDKMRKSHLGKKESQETRKRKSEALRGKIRSDEAREKIGKSKIGNKYNIGRIQSIETKNKISAANKGHEYQAECWKITKPDGNIEIIRNLSKYCRENDLSNWHMTEVSQGKRKHHKGYICQKTEQNK